MCVCTKNLYSWSFGRWNGEWNKWNRGRGYSYHEVFSNSLRNMEDFGHLEVTKFDTQHVSDGRILQRTWSTNLKDARTTFCTFRKHIRKHPCWMVDDGQACDARAILWKWRLIVSNTCPPLLLPCMGTLAKDQIRCYPGTRQGSNPLSMVGSSVGP